LLVIMFIVRSGVFFIVSVCHELFLQENPAEEDAQIVEKILAMRRVKKKVFNQVMRNFRISLHCYSWLKGSCFVD